MSIFRDAALAAWDAGLSPLLVRQDGSKRPFGARSPRTGQPSGAWKRRQRRRCSRRALERVFRRACITGLGIITGAVSGHLRLLEFDCRSTYQMFLAEADSTGFADLVARVRAGYEEETPGGGIHWLVRAPVEGGNTVLARRPKSLDERKHPQDRIKTLIETREEGGFVVTAPSCGRVHPSGGAYRLLSGGFGSIVTISPDEWHTLCALARTFDQMPVQAPRGPTTANSGGRPGDEFAARTSWAEILESAGWTVASQRKEAAAWWRPGKGTGQSISATTNHAGSDLLYVFSTSTAFGAGRGYGKFAAYAILHHDGDFAAAARALAGNGYGTTVTSSTGSRGPRLQSRRTLRVREVP